MILDKINSPQDLKALNEEALKALCEEIRSLIIKTVSSTGGHLASSLGAVELCVALHCCLDTPKDTVIFDVGHQTYAHKIITGRRDSFSTLRQQGGITGFPNSKESEYDPFTSGHASTAISWAQGMAEAKKQKEDKSKTVAIVGDGSLTGGMSFEALNSCGHAESEVLVVVNHNEMSISPSVGALSRYLTKIISAPIYNKIRDEIEGFLSNFSFSKRLVPHARRMEEAIKGLVTPGVFFEELGFRYFGPIDGNNLDVLIPTLKNVIPLKGPRILHIITKKGKGCKHSESNPEDAHSAVPFDIETGQSIKKSKESFGEALAKKLIQIARKDKRIMAVTAAMPKGTGLNLFQEQFSKRTFDVGIAEEHAVGFAAGLARGGLKPVVAIYSTFLQRALDQIIHDVALQDLNVVFALDRAGAVGADGPTHHGVFDIGYMRLVPGMICMAPKDKDELEQMLALALEQKGPVSIRYPKGEAYSLGADEKIRIGKAQTLHEGEDICIVAIGSMTKEALNCYDILEKQDISIGVVNARFIKPLDEDLLRGLARQYKYVITLEEGNLDCGFGSAILEFFDKNNINVNVIRAGFPDTFIPHAKREDLFKMYGLDPQSLSERIANIVNKGVSVGGK
jgi:1-deoxy-D-xylulose-5-phosphate synthase